MKVESVAPSKHCGVAAHEALKRNRAKLEARAVFVGVQVLADQRIDLWNCRRCGNTLGIIKPR